MRESPTLALYWGQGALRQPEPVVLDAWLLCDLDGASDSEGGEI